MLVALALMSKLKLFVSAFCVVKKSIEETETQNKIARSAESSVGGGGGVQVQAAAGALGHRESLEPRA